MKVTYNWLKDFVEIKIPAKALADKLTMAGLEVVSLEEKAGDFIFEIEITSNRPDWLSVLGIAREISVITGAKLKKQTPFKSKTHKGNLKIEIEDKKDCPLYTARIIKNIKVGTSPDWLKKRLELVGCRSVNNVVDITNYCLFELGEPLHAFDLDKLNPDKIIIRRAHSGEKFTTIDGQIKDLNSDCLLIADKHKAIAAAGVMGGKDSEVTESTGNILLEAAVFNPIIVRRSRQALGLQSESSYRFERGVDAGLTLQASLRAAELIQELCLGDEVSFSTSSALAHKEKKIELGINGVSRILGVNIAPAKIKGILTGLGFGVKQKSKTVLYVTVPSFRQDVNSEVDLIEEIARIFGYENIPVSLPAVKPSVTIRDRRDLISELKNTLIGLGLNEVITYSLTDKTILNNLGQSIKPIEVMNPLSLEQEVLRTSLIPGLGRAISFNFNQKQESVQIFEIANVFRGENAPQEELALGIALSGEKSLLLSHGLVKDEFSLLNLKGMLEKVFTQLDVKDYEFNTRGTSGIDILVKQEKVGSMKCLGPEALTALEIKNRDVFILEVSLDKILSCAQTTRRFSPLPKYPGITRDISLLLKNDLSVATLLTALKEKGEGLLRDIKITDYYQGKQIPAGYRGLTISCLYASGERTLTEKEIQPFHELVCAALTQQFGAKIR